MGAIDIGAAAINRDDDSASGYTRVGTVNSANDAGTITSFEVWFATTASGFKVGTTSGSGTSYTSRDYETIGDVTAGSKQTFSGLDCDVETGDFTIHYFSSGSIERDNAGAGVGHAYYISGDELDGDPHTYTDWSDVDFSVYGIGATASGWTNIVKVNGIASANIAKVNGIVVANIAKVNGIAV